MTVTLVDPTLPMAGGGNSAAQRPASLDGAVLGLVSNGKTHARRILNRVAQNLIDSHGARDSLLLVKSTANLPATPEEVEALAADVTAVIAAIGD
ncbi:MAG: hypothetical protein OXF61_11810 [Acidimicrobiaceae bacterium]|uniref:UGSC family (seleno)protein n=1 Tax=Candidatus Poriferisodalis multihospitum TaxID=2983191 RepID=UPI001384C32D|nr:hypothetical protein [Candidatus Poriferisodalis multihospitum]MCY3585727.1 hypothetical protein [Acidimicrobiaceae bacterium]MYA25109.1 hypothetical protein [Acidimicrobiales bacterium]MCY3608811.1 hypothetical protein [Acidimicrobiaceae bacterium]MCY3949875.1 hypothetical protein [Acidimicrobiaceae bacterium]MDE0321894.1 hypothetical protein [Acidimicrobiaceae bacterium]